MDTRVMREDAGLAGAILSWEDIKDRVYPCLAPRRWVKVRGRHAVHRKFLDLAVYYNIRTDITEDGIAHVWVNGDLMHMWGTDMETLDGQARENARKDGYTIRSMEEVIDADPMPFGPYVMTNRHSFYGAAGILDEPMLAQFAETNGADIHILPSSVHELMLIPATREHDVDGLNGMVRDINGWGVMPDERLADHTYRYEAATGDIRIA